MTMNRQILAAAALAAAFGASAGKVPEYPGGRDAMRQFITANLNYPAMAMQNGVEGVVTVGFTVAPDGTLKGVKVMRPIDPDLEKEAVRIVNAMPQWIPADNNGQPVAAPASVSITFTMP